MLNTAPCDWTIDNLAKHIEEGPRVKQGDRIGEGWVPARPYGFYSLRSRLRLAWMVFKGEADALRWPGQMPKAYWP